MLSGINIMLRALSMNHICHIIFVNMQLLPRIRTMTWINECLHSSKKEFDGGTNKLEEGVSLDL